MNNKKLIIITLTIIFLLASVLRLYRITDFPVGFNADEAALGYNAYSLLQTGRDEHGAAWPVAFRSFDDYKAPLYVYLAMPFVAALSLTELAVRLPAALFGIATVVLMYFLAKKLFGQEVIALLAAFFLSVSPWHIHYSRGGWEVNVATFFIAFGVYAFLQALDKPRWFYASFLSFLLSLYTYQSPKLIVPVLVLGLFVLYRKRLWSLKKQLILPIIVGLVCAVPLLSTFVTGAGTARFSGVSIFSDTGPVWGINEARGEHLEDPDSLVAEVFHNKVIGYGLNFLKNYSDHFTPAFLYFTGDPIERNNIPEMGVMYVLDGIFVILGLLFLATAKSTYKKTLLLWLVVAPIAAAITFQTPHALRSANMVIPLVLLVAFGVGSLLSRLMTRTAFVIVAIVLIGLGYTYHFFKYLHQYYVAIPVLLPFANNYGFDELVAKINLAKDDYQKIVITDRYDQPYILFLFYSRKDPRSFQKQVVLTQRDKFNFATVASYDSYEFRAITKADVEKAQGTLLVGTDEEIPDDDSRIIDTIYFPSGKPAFQILDTKLVKE